MVISEFIRSLHSTELFIGGEAKFTADLFDAAGSIQAPVSVETAKSWISGHRQCKIREHFPNDKVDEAGFIKFLSSRANTSWQKLQNAFRPMKNDDDCIVNLDTEKPDIFYWSLLNQFQKIHRLPLSEEPTGAMRIRFKQAIQEYSIDEIITQPYEESSARMVGFLKRIKTDIIEPFKLNQSESSMYKNIKEFYSVLRGYRVCSSPAAYSLFSAYSSHEHELLHMLDQIEALHNEICGTTSLQTRKP